MSGGQNGSLPASKYTQGNITCWSNTAVTYIGLLQLFCVDLTTYKFLGKLIDFL